MELGVGLLTIHPTPTRDLIELARRRHVPWTSRGGGLVIGDLLAGDRPDNVYKQILPDLISHAQRVKTVLSIGATFRAANIFDTLDRAQQGEIAEQLSLADSLRRAGVGVIVESPGHARPRDIIRAAKLLSQRGFPIMPLGPIPTDVAIGQDHISSAIGATLMGMHGAAHILAAVTREEHTGGVPTIESTLEAVEAALVAAHIIDIEMLDMVTEDLNIVTERASQATCIAGKASQGCARCASTCPLVRARDIARNNT
jgi:phosphomethylpyrimidine synthase